MEEKISIVFTSAGNPATWTGVLKEKGIRVVHVVSSSRFAQKAVQQDVMPWLRKALKPEAITEGKKPPPWY